MTLDECYELGYVIKPHGYRGEIMIFLDVDDPFEYATLASVFVQMNQQLVPFVVKQIQVLGEKRGQAQALLKLEDVNTGEQAAALKGCALYLPLDSLPSLGEDEEGHPQFYFHEIIGFTIVDHQLGPLGVITNVYALEHQELIAMEYQRKEVLIPLNDEIVTGIDRDTCQVAVNLPDGLLDVYLEA